MMLNDVSVLCFCDDFYFLKSMLFLVYFWTTVNNALLDYNDNIFGYNVNCVFTVSQ